VSLAASWLGGRLTPDAGRPTQGVRGQAAQGAGVGRESALLTVGGRLGQEPRRGRPAVEVGRSPIRDGVEQCLGDPVVPGCVGVVSVGGKQRRGVQSTIGSSEGREGRHIVGACVGSRLL